MKKFLFAIVALFCAAPTFAQFNSGGFSLDEENLYWGVRLGFTRGGIGGDIESDKGRTGMTLGGVVGLRVTESTPLFLESGLYYTERGGKDLKLAGDQSDAKGHLNYLEIPLLIKYGFMPKDEIAILPFIGPYLALGVSGNYQTLRHPEMGFKLGCGVEWNYLYVELAYHLGATNIADYEVAGKDFTSHGHALGINIGINF